MHLQISLRYTGYGFNLVRMKLYIFILYMWYVHNSKADATFIQIGAKVDRAITITGQNENNILYKWPVLKVIDIRKNPNMAISAIIKNYKKY